MALGNLTRQLATQALGNTIDKVMDKPAPAVPADSLCATVLGQVHAMQKALKDDQELVVLLNSGAERLRVLEIYAPSPQLVVLTGVDAEKIVTRVVSPIESIQLVCKVMKVQPPAKPTRVALITPKPKPE